MSEQQHDKASGTWRQGEFVRWQDLFVALQALLVWFGLLTLAFSVVFAIHDQLGISRAEVSNLVGKLTTNISANQIATATFELVLLFYAWRVARRVAENSLVARYRSFARGTFVIALLSGVALALTSIVLNAQLAAHSIVEFHTTKAERALFPHAPQDFPLTLVCVALIAPFAEELYFRGLVLSWLRRKLGAPLAVLASAAVFALLHFRFVSHTGADGWVYTATIAFVGVVTATVALVTRSLWNTFAIHAGYNATLVAVVTLAPLLIR
jgi:membrane protease YdiL (CAAX protease family)